MHRHILLALFLVPTLALAQLSAGPERAVADPLLASPIIYFAAAATSGSGSIVAFQPAGSDAVYFQRLDANARPLLSSAAPIATTPAGNGAFGRILSSAASDGKGYVVVWSEKETLWTTYIGLTGETVHPQVLVPSGVLTNTTSQSKIASNGNGYIVSWMARATQGTSQMIAMARRLDSAGNPVGDAFAITDVRSWISELAIASNGHDYLAAVQGNSPTSNGGYILDTTIVPISGDSGAPATGQHVLVFGHFGLAWAGAAYVLAWSTGPTVEAATVDAAGHMSESEVIGRSGTVVSVAGSSNGAMVTILEPAGPTGVMLGPTGHRIGFSTVSQLGPNTVAGTAAAGGYFGVNVNNGPANVGMLPPVMIDPPLPYELHPLALFPLFQSRPRLVTMGDQRVVTWLETNNLRAMRLPDDTAATLVTNDAASYAVGSSATRTAIAWSTTKWVFVRVLAADGTLSTPVLLGTANSAGAVDAILWSGGSFVVVWHAGSASEAPLLFARVDPAGTVTSPAAPFPLPLSAPNVGIQARNLTLLPTTSGFLAVFDEYLGLPVGVNQHDDAFAIPFNADASTSGPRIPIAATLDAEVVRGAATDGNGHVLAVYTTLPFLGGPGSLMAVPLDERGNPTGDPRRLGDGNINITAQVSWNGTNFVVVSGNQAALVSADGRIVVPMTTILTDQTLGDTVVAANTIAYTRVIADGQRVFVRSLAPGRRRATR